MQFADLQARAAFLAQLPGGQEISPAPDWPGLVNRALIDFGWESEYNIETTQIAAVVNQIEYVLPPPYFKTITHVFFGPVTLLNNSSPADEYRNNPDWLALPAGNPLRWITTAPNVLHIIPAPSDISVNTYFLVRGVRTPAALVNPTDSPTFPDRWHEAIALRAAYLHAFAWAGVEDMKRLAVYETTFKQMVADCRNYIGSERWGQIQRQVSRRNRARISLRSH